MARRIAILSLLAALLGCCPALLAARSHAAAPFVAAGAQNVQIAEVAPGERLITYQMANPQDGWLSAVARRLSLSGWRLSADGYQWGDTENYIPSYTRTSRIWFVELRERAELLGDRRNARVEISYTLVAVGAPLPGR